MVFIWGVSGMDFWLEGDLSGFLGRIKNN